MGKPQMEQKGQGAHTVTVGPDGAGRVTLSPETIRALSACYRFLLSTLEQDDQITEQPILQEQVAT